jgi:hypothetical protein
MQRRGFVCRALEEAAVDPVGIGAHLDEDIGPISVSMALPISLGGPLASIS